MGKLSLANTILGRPLATEEEDQQRLGAAAGIPVFGLDALSSAAYGPEAALMVLLPLGAAGAVYILPITAAICVLLGIVYLSYRQTIAAGFEHPRLPRRYQARCRRWPRFHLGVISSVSVRSWEKSNMLRKSSMAAIGRNIRITRHCGRILQWTAVKVLFALA